MIAGRGRLTDVCAVVTTEAAQLGQLVGVEGARPPIRAGAERVEHHGGSHRRDLGHGLEVVEYIPRESVQIGDDDGEYKVAAARRLIDADHAAIAHEPLHEGVATGREAAQFDHRGEIVGGDCVVVNRDPRDALSLQPAPAGSHSRGRESQHPPGVCP